jgi:hypothetical protein
VTVPSAAARSTISTVFDSPTASEPMWQFALTSVRHVPGPVAETRYVGPDFQTRTLTAAADSGPLFVAVTR